MFRTHVKLLEALQTIPPQSQAGPKGLKLLKTLGREVKLRFAKPRSHQATWVINSFFLERGTGRHLYIRHPATLEISIMAIGASDQAVLRPSHNRTGRGAGALLPGLSSGSDTKRLLLGTLRAPLRAGGVLKFKLSGQACEDSICASLIDRDGGRSG